MTLAKDKTKVYETFTDFFQFMGDVATDGSSEDSDQPINKTHPDVRPFPLSSIRCSCTHHLTYTLTSHFWFLNTP